jgi:hypothetical protein
VVFVEKGRNLFIILVVAIAVVATVGLTVALARLDPDPRQIRFDRSRRMGAPEAQSTQT